MATPYTPAGGCDATLNTWCERHCGQGFVARRRLQSSTAPSWAWSCVPPSSLLPSGELQPGASSACGTKSHVPSHARLYPPGAIQSAEDAALLAELSMCNASAAGIAVNTHRWNHSSGYWREANGRPKHSSPELYEIGPPSRHQIKSFSLHPPTACGAHGVPHDAATSAAEAAFGARYAFGWTKAADPAPLAAIEQHEPRYYYTRPADRPSASGIGSDLGKNFTRGHLRFLMRQLERLPIATMLDAPCGDVNWQTTAWAVDSLKAYVGLDIVRRVISLDRLRFAHHSNKRFAHWDVAACPLPRISWGGGSSGSEAVDLILLRHVLQHLPLERAAMALQHAVRSGTRYIVATTFLPAGTGGARLSGRNSHTHEGGWFSNDLTAPPFSLHAPDECLHDEDGQIYYRPARDDVNDPRHAMSLQVSTGSGAGGSSRSDSSRRARPTRASAICLWTFDEAHRAAWLAHQLALQQPMNSLP